MNEAVTLQVALFAIFAAEADSRDLKYAQFFSAEEEKLSHLDDYTLHNTTRLNVEQIKQLLLKLDYIKEELHA